MHKDDESNCGGCPLGAGSTPRREFLRDAIAQSLAAVAALAGVANVAEALTVAFVRGEGSRAAKKYPIPATDGVSIDKDESVIVARVGDRIYAFSLACPHQNTALRWDAKENRFQCPKHKSRYQPNGVFIEGRATRGLDRFAVKQDGDSVLVDLDALYREDKNAAQWQAAFITLSREK